MYDKPKTSIKLYYIYYLLAGFDLLTICFTLYLGHRIHNIYETSYKMNQEWAEKLSHLDHLGNQITQLNGPGNDVFNSLDTKSEKSKFNELHITYRELFKAILIDVEKFPVGEKRQEISRSLEKISISVDGLKGEANSIFKNLDAKDSKKAGYHMARMDEHFSDAIIELSKVRTGVRGIQKEDLGYQHELAKELFQKEWYILSFVFVILFIIVFYGHRLKIQIESQEQLIKDQNAKLISQSKLSSLGEMAGGIAHEINNPIAIIYGNAYKLKKLNQLGRLEETHIVDSYEKILETCDRIQKIIKGLRSFSRDSSDDEKHWVSLYDLVTKSISLTEMKMKSEGIQLRGFENKNFKNIQVLCREIQISQVLVNLINNSAHAIENLDEKWISIEIEQNADFLKLKITDAGSGISPQIADKIMQPFFTTKEIGVGTGLGLGIGYGIMKSHGGLLSLNSQAKNTQFIMEFPAADIKVVGDSSRASA